jgi:hypothetical protein
MPRKLFRNIARKNSEEFGIFAIAPLSAEHYQTLNLPETTLIGRTFVILHNSETWQIHLRQNLEVWGADVLVFKSLAEMEAEKEKVLRSAIFVDVHLGYLAKVDFGKFEPSMVIGFSDDSDLKARSLSKQYGYEDFIHVPTDPFSVFSYYKVADDIAHGLVPSPPSQTIDFGYFERLYAEDKAAIVEMLELYLTEYEEYRQLLFLHLVEGNELEFRKVKHKIVYSLYLLGLGGLRAYLEAASPRFKLLSSLDRTDMSVLVDAAITEIIEAVRGKIDAIRAQ